MRVKIYGAGWEEFGAIRFEVEWITVKPSVQYKDGIDPDTDTETHVEYFSDQDAAMKRAQHIYDNTQLCWGIVLVQKQVVDWFVEEDRIADWHSVGHELEIYATTHYADYIAAKTASHT